MNTQKKIDSYTDKWWIFQYYINETDIFLNKEAKIYKKLLENLFMFNEGVKSIKKMSELCCISRESVSKTCKHLKQIGVINLEKTGNKIKITIVTPNDEKIFLWKKQILCILK